MAVLTSGAGEDEADRVDSRMKMTRYFHAVTKSQDVVARPPYRCTVGLMIKTDKVSEQQLC
jgi:hypothetical protein